MEIWKTYTNDPRYEVSSYGNIRTTKTSKLRKFRKNPTGYYRFNIRDKDKHLTLMVHRVVALTFIANPLNKPHINHIDNDPTNNHINNLEWCTHQENMEHSVKQGRKGGGTPYSASQIYDCKYTYVHLSGYTVSKLTNVKVSTINRVRRGEQWKHI
jgi:hypothetical protein